MSEWIRQLDKDLFFLINHGIENNLFDLLMPFITSKAYLIAFPFLVLYLLKEKKRALIIFAISFFSIIFADGLANTIKHLIGRERPCNVFENVRLLVGCTRSFSMPSNHASNAIAFAIPFLLSRRITDLRAERLTECLKYVFFSLAILVCFSRVYVGVHYPSDVIVGSIVGTLAATGMIGLYKWAAKRFHKRPYFTVMSVFLILISLFRFYYILHGPLDLSPDEAHYWEWSRRLDMSYYSKGPMIAYLIAIGTGIFGDNVFGVRFLAVVFSLLSSIYLYKLGRDMYHERMGAFSAIMSQIIPLYSAFGVIFTIDSPFLFFWIISLYLFWKVIKIEQKSERAGDRNFRTSELQNFKFVFLGLTIGLGLLTKYTMAFFYLCAFLFILIERRDLLKRPAPYIAFIIGFFIFSPVIIWNAQHDWVTIRHTAGQAHIGEGLRVSLKSLLEFVGSQLGVITPIIFVMLIVSLVKIRKDENGNFLFWFSMPVIAFFTLKSLHGKVQANWAMTGYITGLLALSRLYFQSTEVRKPRSAEARKSSVFPHSFAFRSSALPIFRTITMAGIVTALLLNTLSHYPPAFLPVKLDPSSRLKGWKSLGKEVSLIYEEMKKDGDLFIFSDRYQVSSELAFYVKGNPVTYCVNLGRRMNQYDLWPGFNNLVHYNAIFVTIGRTELNPKIREGFERCEGRVFEAYEHNRPIREYSIFTCYDFKGIKTEGIRSY